ncbi:MAG: hypothetical protein M1837_000037 [Sclerophora amabilis]|nr:MAG: hypothetical protein M1837_000037 [Sclerophora amabilis]
MMDNPRFSAYCPFCQISTGPSSLPSSGLRDPPAYSSPPQSPDLETVLSSPPPPSYTVEPPSASTSRQEQQGQQQQEQQRHQASGPPKDVVHYLHPTRDTIPSLSLLYGVPIPILRERNHLFADHLLAARRTVLIPGDYYKGGVSLSPNPVQGEEEELRKAKVRRWMVACKVVEYDIALIYLKQADYNLETAIEAYKADERWERDHPMSADGAVSKSRFKGKQPQYQQYYQQQQQQRRRGAGGGSGGLGSGFLGRWC